MKQCVSDTNPADDHDPPDWWVNMTKEEQDESIRDYMEDILMMVEAERREAESNEQ